MASSKVAWQALCVRALKASALQKAVVKQQFKFTRQNALNRVQLIGHEDKSQKLKNLEGGKKLANITLATKRSILREKTV
jgi:hypothetical protein